LADVLLSLCRPVKSTNPDDTGEILDFARHEGEAAIGDNQPQ
jgi:hypothetical protein